MDGKTIPQSPIISSPKAAGLSLSFSYVTPTLLLLILILFTGRLASLRHLIFDDAFITYRYAAHLAEGHGITWNPGEPATEGYTTFLQLVILAPFIKTGFDPLMVARVFSLLALFGICLLLYKLARKQFQALSGLALLIAATFLLATQSAGLSMVGMESILFTFGLFLAFFFLRQWSERENQFAIYWFGLCSFFAFLLRPEALLLFPAAIVSAIAFRKERTKEWNRSVKALAVTFLVPFAIYMFWKYLHFGPLLPNSFYVKAGHSGFYSDEGLKSVAYFFKYHRSILGILLLSFFWKAGYKHRFIDFTAVLLILCFLLFYIRVDTLMDIYGRFLYPITPFILYLSSPLLAYIYHRILSWKKPHVFRFVILGGFFAAFFYQNPAGDRYYTYEDVANGEDHSSLMRKEYEAGKALKDYPRIRTTKIAFGDAGVIPFLTGAPHLDVAGLNDGFIARERNLRKLTTYFFARNPTLILHPGNKDHTWIRYGDGPLGDYSQWAQNKNWDRYKYVGTIRTGGAAYDIHMFIRKDYEDFKGLTSFLLERVADGYYVDPPFSIGSHQPPAVKDVRWVSTRPSGNLSFLVASATPNGKISFFQLAMLIQSAKSYKNKDCFDICYETIFHSSDAERQISDMDNAPQQIGDKQEYRRKFHGALLGAARLMLLPKLSLQRGGERWMDHFDPAAFRAELNKVLFLFGSCGEIGKEIESEFQRVRKRIDLDGNRELSDAEIRNYVEIKLELLQ